MATKQLLAIKDFKKLLISNPQHLCIAAIYNSAPWNTHRLYTCIIECLKVIDDEIAMETVFAGKNGMPIRGKLTFIEADPSGKSAFKGFPRINLSVGNNKKNNQLIFDFCTPWFEIDMAYKYINNHLGDLEISLDLSKPLVTNKIDHPLGIWATDSNRLSRYSQEVYDNLIDRLNKQIKDNTDVDSELRVIMMSEMITKAIVFMYRKRHMFANSYKHFMKSEQTRNELVDLAKSCLENSVLKCAAKDIFDYSEACQSLKENVDQQLETIRNHDFSVSFAPENINAFQKSLLAVTKRTARVNMKIKKETAPYRYILTHAEKEIAKSRKKQLIKQKRKK